VTLVVAIALAAATAIPEVRTLAGFGVVVLLPGYLAATLVLGQDRPDSLMVMTTLLLGLALVVLGGMLLSASPFGLTGVAVIAAIAAAGVLFAAWRRDAFASPWLRRGFEARPPAGALVALAAAAIVAVGAVAIAVRAADASPAASVWQLWLTRPAADVMEAGASVAAGPPGDARIELRADGRVVDSWDDVHLAAGDRWTVQISPAAIPSGTSQLELMLSADGGRTARMVTFDVDDGL
jgi:hypothetical protein